MSFKMLLILAGLLAVSGGILAARNSGDGSDEESSDGGRRAPGEIFDGPPGSPRPIAPPGPPVKTKPGGPLTGPPKGPIEPCEFNLGGCGPPRFDPQGPKVS